jgi:predicted nuclease of predicted toxin-antitoxin system
MKIKLYADENFPLRTVEELRKLGHDVLTAFEDDRANQAIADEEVLSRATELNRVILTLNRLDFKRLHQANSKHLGIIICTEDTDKIRQAKLISEKIAENESLEDKLIRVYRPSIQNK